MKARREFNFDRNRESIAETTRLLQAIIRGHPADIPKGFKEALASQNALARFTDGRAIISMSLNTQKKYAEDQHIAFGKFDQLRIKAKQALETGSTRSAPSNKRDKPGLLKRVSELEEELRRRDRELMLLTSVVGRMLAFFSVAFKGVADRRVLTMWSKEKSALQQLTDPFLKESQKDNVTSLAKARSSRGVHKS